MLPNVVLKRRIHDNNSSVLNRYAVNDYVHIMKAALDRKKKKRGKIDACNKHRSR